jgi:hypothetical protein
MTKRKISILNFSTTLILFLATIVTILRSLITSSSDKDGFAIVFLIVIILYLGGIIYLFYNGVFNWEEKQAQSFYGATFPVAGLSFFLLISFIRNIGDRAIGILAIEQWFFLNFWW